MLHLTPHSNSSCWSPCFCNDYSNANLVWKSKSNTAKQINWCYMSMPPYTDRKFMIITSVSLTSVVLFINALKAPFCFINTAEESNVFIK